MTENDEQKMKFGVPRKPHHPVRTSIISLNNGLRTDHFTKGSTYEQAN